MSHPTLPTEVRPCRSGKHGQHVVVFLDELTAECTPPCEAAIYRHECHHVREACERRAKRIERELRFRLRTGGSWLEEIDLDGLTERIEAERLLLAAGRGE